jgi:hypothetical protein
MKALILSWRQRAVILGSAVAVLVALTVRVFAQTAPLPESELQAVIAETVPDNATPLPNATVTVAINVDVSALQAPNNKLGSYTATMEWDPTVLRYAGNMPGSSPWGESNVTKVIETNAALGRLDWSATSTEGSVGKANILNVIFTVVGVVGSRSDLRLSFSDMSTTTFRDIRSQLTFNIGTVIVRSPNRAPVLAAIPDQTMNEGAALDVAISATDPDGNRITLSASNLPPFGSFTDNRNGTGRIRFAPNFFAAGVYPNIQVTATDDGTPPSSATVSFKLTVNNVNRPPQIRPPDAITLLEGEIRELTLSAEDPDGDSITLRMNNLPGFGDFVDNRDGTGKLRLAPGRDDAGAYPNITLVATDNGTPNLSASTQLDLTIVDRFPSLVCTTEIASPANGAVITADSVDVCVVTQVSGTVGQVKKDCFVNGIQLVGLCAKVPVINGFNTIIATCTFTDSLSSCVSADTIRIEARPIDPLRCSLTLAPPSGAIICGDSVEVVGTITITGGTPGYTKICDVNGVPARNTATGFILKLPCTPGNNTFIATCKVTDVQNRTAVCVDTINVICPAPLVCKVEITVPTDSALICDKTVKVTAVTSVAGGVPNYTPICDINGVAAVGTGNTFTATVPLTSGWNNLIATCTVTDSCGKTVVCRDTIRVRSIIDKNTPTCTLRPGPKSVTGTFYDNESGIAKIEPLFLYNAKLTIDPFVPGAKQVNFRLDDLGLDSYIGFEVKVTDLCGNSHVCDPVMSSLSADDEDRVYTLKFRSVDRYLIMANHGLSEIRVDLNGHPFVLSVASNSNVRKLNTYLIPGEGSITIDLKPYLREGENIMRLEIEGRAGTSADLTLIDEAHAVDHILELQPIPTAFQLSQNYPNPFNPSTTIRFGIPAHVVQGAAVQLRLYNALGELVRTLVDEKMFPGQYAVKWDGRNARGETVASGIYIYQLWTNGFKETKRMIFLK